MPLSALRGHPRTVWYWRALRQMTDDGAPPALLGWALAQGCVYVRQLPDGRFLGVERHGAAGGSLWVGTARLIEDLWLYPDRASALQAARAWDGTTPEPTDWHHHPISGRRRPDGDPAREYVQP